MHCGATTICRHSKPRFGRVPQEQQSRLSASLQRVSHFFGEATDAIANHWFSQENFLFFAPVFILVVGRVVGIIVSNTRGHEKLPFVLLQAIVFLG